eukprot:m.182017 g.182017  ORF g.182017 m.182017 type:complete len:217 (-) comp15522_c0_seq3:535-1185(-)
MSVEDSNAELPRVFRACISYLTQPSALAEEGLFRVPGSVKQINYISKCYKEGAEFDLTASCQDPNNVAGLLKLELKATLPERQLAGHDLGEVMGNGGDDEAIKATLAELPLSMQVLLCGIFRLFEKITLNKEKNKMGADQLAVSVGPTLLPNMVTTARLAIVRKLVEQWKDIFTEEVVEKSSMLLEKPTETGVLPPETADVETDVGIDGKKKCTIL